MSEQQLLLSQRELVKLWEVELPRAFNKGDSVNVYADEADEQALRIYIAIAGHSMYSFDFKCTYEDSREIKVELIDVEQDGIHIDERTEIVQEIIEENVRHIHECAQKLQYATKAGGR